MKFTIVDAEAKMLLRHAVDLAAGQGSPDSHDYVAVHARKMLASLLGLKSISFDINEFGILTARCEDVPVKPFGRYPEMPEVKPKVKTVGHYPVELDGSSERAPIAEVDDPEFDAAARKAIDANSDDLPLAST